MPLLPMTELLEKARLGGYAVGYFEAWNLESLKAVIRAAEEARSPVIIGFNGGMLTKPARALGPENLEYYGQLGQAAARSATVPVALILNEIDSLSLVVAGIRFGFNAVMFEVGSGQAGGERARTRNVVELAHGAGVTVESNVGQLPTGERGGLRKGDKTRVHTQPEDAARFVADTGVDALGVSVGNVEILMEGQATIDFELLAQIRNAVPIPLVLHGGTGTADADVKRLVECGIAKINLGAALNRAFLRGMTEAWQSSGRDASPKFVLGSGLGQDILVAGETAMTELVKHKMAVYGSAGQADAARAD